MPVYEITLVGMAGPAVQAALEEFRLDVGDGRTVLTADLPDSAAFYGLLDRVRDVGLEVLEIKHAAPGRLG
jgi:hypothetical protein